MQAGPDAVPHVSYIECVRSLFVTPAPMLVMSIGYIASFSVLAFISNDGTYALFAVLGVFSFSLRVVGFLYGATYADLDDFTATQASMAERVFAITYVQFAGLLGVSAVYTLASPDARFHALMICLIVGYGAGAVATIGLRPNIAAPSLLVAIVPAIIAIGWRHDPVYWMIAVLMSGLLASGLHNLLSRYRSISEGIARRLAFQNLARRDVLTELPNRLGLREWFEANRDSTQKLALHCLDLNGFKPVNDVYGHPVGDDLLKAVAQRLARAIRPTDIVARIGGDEFVVIQKDASDLHEVATLARRLRHVVSEPYTLRGHAVSISTGIGYALADRASADLDELLRQADGALYHAKRGKFGIACARAGQDQYMDVAA